MQDKVGMVLGESVIVQEGPVLIAKSFCFSMKGYEWMSDVHCLQGQVALVARGGCVGGAIANALVNQGVRDAVCVRRLGKLKRIALAITEDRGKLFFL